MCFISTKIVHHYLGAYLFMCVFSCECRYLEEVGYSDTILDMRSKRVRSLLGRSSPESNGPPPPSEASPEPEPRAGGESLLVRQIEEQIKRWDCASRCSLSLTHTHMHKYCYSTEKNTDDTANTHIVQHKKKHVTVYETNKRLMYHDLIKGILCGIWK